MKNLIIILAAIFMFSSCEDVIDVELKEMDQDLYVVEAKITTIDNPWVNITMSLPVTVDEDYEGVSNAVVSISNDAQRRHRKTRRKIRSHPGD